MPVEITQHNEEIVRNLASWARKPVLRRIYRAMHEQIAGEISQVPGMLVELGSGIGNIKEVLPGCLRTDLFPNPWLDQIENAYRLSFADGSVSNLILFDVFHHLRYPGTALREFTRVLAPGGRVIIFEPAMGLLGRIIFGLFHHEPIALRAPISWHSPPGWSADAVDYYAAQGNAWRIFRRGAIGSSIEGLTLLSVRRHALLSYAASGGYSRPQLYPDALYPAMQAVDRLLDHWPAAFATRMLVTLERPA